MSRWPPPPTLSAAFYKGHGLGNDYLVFEEGDDWVATPGNVRRVCDRHRGVGSDGIVVLLGGRGGDDALLRLRMFNPDGSEFERSGNGLRVLASYLVRSDPSVGEVDVEVGGDRVHLVAHGRHGPLHDVSVDMGRARTGAEAIGMDADALDSGGRLPGPAGGPLVVLPVSVGNPHVVVFCEGETELTQERLAEIGPWLAAHPAIAHGTNVQLALADGGGRCRVEIWERGVGRTSASGTSACAVGVAMVATGAASHGEVVVGMPGGELRVSVTPDLDVVLRGPVEEVAEGRLVDGLVGKDP